MRRVKMSCESSELVRKFARATLASVLAVFAAGSLGLLTSCQQQQPSDEQIREQAAQATQRAKEGTKQIVQDARVAAANAARQVDDVAAGVKEGMKSDHSAGARTDLNSASQSELASLPGISSHKAEEIREHRPYASTHQLVSRGVLTESQYDAIASKVTAR
jgi:DNA uptake protein ComE-like DNA-binding protein